MKKFKTYEAVTYLGIAATLLLVLMFLSGCSMKLYKQSPADTRRCCERVSLLDKEMDKFNRYCKVAVFLAKSENNKDVGSGVKKAARQAVDVCKFVLNVPTDEELISTGDERDYYRVRSYIIKDTEDPYWIRMQCDPAEIHCEEF
jgi:hypothetical protein